MRADPPGKYAEATAKAAPNIPLEGEISTVDTNYFGRISRFNPDDLVGKKGLQIYDKMLKDEQVKAALQTIEHAVLSSGYEIQQPKLPDAEADIMKEQADFVDFNFKDMKGSFDDKLQEQMTAWAYGFAVSEIVYKYIDGGQFDGKVGLQDIKTRRPTSIDFEVDEYGNLLPDGVLQGSKRMPPEKFVIYAHNKQFSNPYGNSELRACYRCYSDDTEILSESGWKAIKDISTEEKVATLNSETDALEYHKPTRLYKFPYRGKMFHQSGRFIDLLVTPNHRMWAKGENETNYRFIEATELPRHTNYKRDAVWVGVEQEYFELSAVQIGHAVRTGTGSVFYPKELPARSIKMDAWLSFFGIWLAEGCTHKTKNGQRIIAISQSKSSRHLVSIREWIKAAGFKAYEHSDRDNRISFEIFDAQLWEYLRSFGKSRDKFIPQEIKKLSVRQLRILYDAMMAGDGRHNRDYCTVSKCLADDVAEIIFKMGYAANVLHEKCKNKYGGAIWAVSRNERRIDRTRCNFHKDQREWLDYDGSVYCLEVPNHIVYARRNGKACWSGNSWWSKENVYRFMLIALERYGEPIMDISHKGTITPAQRTVLENFGKNLQNKSLAIHPDTITIDFKNPPPRAAEAYIPAIQGFDTHIRIAILMPGLMGMSAEQQVGSRARSSTEFNVFLWIIEQRRNSLETIINEQIIKRLIDLNYEVTGGQYPTFKFTELTQQHKKEIFEMYLKAVAGIAVHRIPEDEAKLRAIMDFPPAPEGLAPLPEIILGGRQLQGSSMPPGFMSPTGQPPVGAPANGGFIFQDQNGHLYERSFEDETKLIEFIQSLKGAA